MRMVTLAAFGTTWNAIYQMSNREWHRISSELTVVGVWESNEELMCLYNDNINKGTAITFTSWCYFSHHILSISFSLPIIINYSHWVMLTAI